ncbi:MAG TPA: cell division protein ZapA [Thermodesulfovibrionales bacterium]|jgi:cell division protein ZapA|nr:cell division protein ZapA [Thermodesulfovibrionales bacterium]
MGSVEVYILGQKYTIKGDAPEEYIQQLANYVQDKIKEVYNNSPSITPVKASILAAITIADELHRLRNEQENLTKSIEEKTVELTRLFD